jgi:hypothetical protein
MESAHGGPQARQIDLVKSCGGGRRHWLLPDRSFLGAGYAGMIRNSPQTSRIRKSYLCVTIWGRVLSMMARSSFCSWLGI